MKRRELNPSKEQLPPVCVGAFGLEMLLAAAADEPQRVYFCLKSRRVARGMSSVQLGEKQFRLALTFACGTELSSGDVLHAVWGDDPDGGPVNSSSAVSTIIFYLRDRLEPVGLSIRTRNSFGFSLTDVSVTALEAAE